MLNRILYIIDLILRRPNLVNGFIFQKPQKEDWEVTELGMTEKELLPSKNWKKYHSAGERQKRDNSAETMACFPYNTEVLMEDFSTKKISFIKKGEYVISHTGRKQKVTDTLKKDFNEELYKIKIKGVYESITCTKEHPILTDKGWKKAEELIEKDIVKIPLVNNLVRDCTIHEVEKNKDFLWLLGMYLAEGSLGNNQVPRLGNEDKKLKVRGDGNGSGTITFTLHKDEIKYIERIQNICDQLFSFDIKVYEKKDTNGITLQGYNINLRNLLEELGGRGSSSKKINSRLMYLNPTLQLEIYRGWIDGDGYVNKEERKIQGISISENLILQMQRILLRNKIKCRTWKREAYQNHKEAYELCVNGVEINKIYDWNLSETYNIKNRERSSRIEENFLLRPITNIEKTKIHNVRKVYNLEVENDNSYIVNSVAVHNCVTYSVHNVMESIMNRMKEMVKDKIADEETIELVKIFKYFEFYDDKGEANLSDPYTAKLSNTTYRGNLYNNVLQSVRHNGVVAEKFWATPDQYTHAEYYKNVDLEVFNKGKLFTKYVKVSHRWVRPNIFNDIKRYSPIATSVYAGADWNQDKIHQRTSMSHNHAVANGYYKLNEYDGIMDSYLPYNKKVAWNYNLGIGKIISFRLKHKLDIEIKHKCSECGLEHAPQYNL
tara:strand:+ start:703 stop:2688 length:1986 start_codon:yes stop_codon:yes gene_type:complete